MLPVAQAHDVIENRDSTVTSTWAGDILADVAGGAGDDTMHVDGDLSKPTERTVTTVTFL